MKPSSAAARSGYRSSPQASRAASPRDHGSGSVPTNATVPSRGGQLRSPARYSPERTRTRFDAQLHANIQKQLQPRPKAAREQLVERARSDPEKTPERRARDVVRIGRMLNRMCKQPLQAGATVDRFRAGLKGLTARPREDPPQGGRAPDRPAIANSERLELKDGSRLNRTGFPGGSKP